MCGHLLAWRSKVKFMSGEFIFSLSVHILPEKTTIQSQNTTVNRQGLNWPNVLLVLHSASIVIYTTELTFPINFPCPYISLDFRLENPWPVFMLI